MVVLLYVVWEGIHFYCISSCFIPAMSDRMCSYDASFENVVSVVGD